MKKPMEGFLWELFFLALGVIVYLYNSGWRMDARAWVFYIMYASVALWCGARHAPVQGRAALPSPDSKWEQSLYAAHYAITYFVLHSTAGLYAGYAPEIGPLFWLGIALGLLSAALQVSGIELTRAHGIELEAASPDAELICERGPYRAVRMPVILGKVLWCAVAALIFGTPAVALVALLCAGVIAARAFLSDRNRRKSSPEYAEYARRVRWRMIPHVW